MKLMRCPLNGRRNISEFRYGGEVVPHPDASACTDAQWADYVFMEENSAGMVREWWCHVASGYWFIAERNTVTDEIERTYPSEELSGAELSRTEQQADDKGERQNRERQK